MDYPNAESNSGRICRVYLAIDIEKVFDTVSRQKLIDTLDINKLTGDDELRIIQYLMSNTTL